MSGTFKDGIGRIILDDGKTFEWPYHVGFFTAQTDIEKAVLKAAGDLLAYASSFIPPPLPGDKTVGGSA